ncbi:hypothetical protein NQ317_005594 [Molorchus minor]|uniref:Uncharacterized protein n=1 Tax=Molorchus minor TaxID=1323400 RepID=A0ABQ9K8D2_9CUCU|nr:hypothetical protein NQ317_005594 [Molorchus minor]
MGNEHAKPDDKLKYIDREVNSLRSSIRSSSRNIPKETKEGYVQNLVKLSSDASCLKGKVKQNRLESTQRNISNTMNEILTTIPKESDLDLGAVETTSFIQMPIGKKQTKNSSKRPKSLVAPGKRYPATLQEIEDKFESLKPQIDVAIETKDTTQLRVHQETIKVLVTDLEMIEVFEDTPIGDRKKTLDSKITAQYHRIVKAVKEIKRDKNIDYLVKQNKKDKVLKELEDVQKSLAEAETLKINENLKNNSQTDLSKAQLSYEDIVKNIARGKNKNKEEIKAKLQSLQAFINNIKEDDENSLKRKQQLLNNVKQSFSFILTDENIDHASTDSVPTKVESNYKDVGSFYEAWKSIQTRIKSNKLPIEEVSKIDKVLEDIQNSIAKTRAQIAGKGMLAISKGKLNSSTPNLSPSKVLVPKFGSSLSVDDAGKALIKTRAKVYDLTPEVHNINDQPVVLRNKKFYKVNNEIIPDGNRLSKVEEIKLQVNYIKEKLPESPQKQHLKNKLESYANILEDYVHDKNQAIASNAKLVLANIQEMLQNMSQIQKSMNSSLARRLSVEESFENVVAIQEAVEKLKKRIDVFHGRKDGHDYRKIREELMYCRRCLQETRIPSQYEMIQQQKDENSNIARTREKMENLKDKVNRFTGGYKGVLYNKIEKDLNKLLVDISDTVDDKDVADEIVKDAEKNLKILENKATRDQSFRRTLNDNRKNENEEQLAKLKSDLLDIKKSIDTTPTNAVNLFIGLRSRLDLVKIGLDQLKISIEDEEKQREVLKSEVDSLKTVVEAKIALARQAVRQWPLEQDRIKRDGEELVKIEEKFKSLKPEIENFVGTTSDNKFYELDESSIRLVLKMDKLQFSAGTDNHTRKINLLKEIYNYGDLLDRRAKETEDIIEIEREIYDIERNYERYIRLNDVENLLDKISALRKKIKNTETNRNLMPRKLNCVKKVDALFEKITTNEVKTKEGVVVRRDSKDPATEISNVAQTFNSIKEEIDSFAGIHADKKYYELEGKLTSLFPKLDKFKLPDDSELQAKKIKLLKEMHLYCDILDKRAKETELIREITKQLNSIDSHIQDFKNTNEELKVLDTELRSMQMKLDKCKISGEQEKQLKEKFERLVAECLRLRQAKDPPKNTYIGSSSFLVDVQNNQVKSKVPQYNPDSVQTELTTMQREVGIIKRVVTRFANSDTSEEYKKNRGEFIGAKPETNWKKINNRLLEPISEVDRDVIDEKLISLQVKLGKMQVIDDLNQKKGMFANKILMLSKRLKEKRPEGEENISENTSASLMGVSVSRSSSLSKRITMEDILNEKEYVFLVLQTEIDKAISNGTRQELRHIEDEIKRHINELNDLIKHKRWKTETTERVQRLIYNYEISLAKVRSIFNTISKLSNKSDSESNKEDLTAPQNDNTAKDNLIAFSEKDSGSEDEDEPTYANLEDLDPIIISGLKKSNSFGAVSAKPPVPIPRNNQDNILVKVKELPNFFTRLTDISEKDVIDSKDIEEVLAIRKTTNDIRNVFVSKMDEIFRRYETSVTDKTNNDM